MNPADYFVLSLKNVAGDSEEWLSQQAFAHGALGISEALAFIQPEGEEDVFTRIGERRALDIYFQAAPPPVLIDSLRLHLPEAEFSIKGEVNRDWLAEWKKGFQPFALVADHWVVPSWCEPPAVAKHKIWIDPGMAFGTGTHETTQLVAEALRERLLFGKFHSCLDVGTGTGILAVLACQLGIARVRATEIEADARRVARETFAANDCASVVLTEAQVEELDDTYDIVIANIIDGVLVRIQDSLKARVKSGGWLILSGIIAEREADFLKGFHLPEGVTWSPRVQKGDWLLYAARF